MGINVHGSDGSRIGAIADIVSDIKGQVVYVVLSHGGILGIGDKLIPLPWELISPGEKAGTVAIQLNKSALEKAPNFDSNNWPDFTKSEWKAKTEDYYSTFQKMTDRNSSDNPVRENRAVIDFSSEFTTFFPSTVWIVGRLPADYEIYVLDQGSTTH